MAHDSYSLELSTNLREVSLCQKKAWRLVCKDHNQPPSFGLVRTDSFNKEKAVFEHCELREGSLTALQITPLLSGKVEQVEHVL